MGLENGHKAQDGKWTYGMGSQGIRNWGRGNGIWDMGSSDNSSTISTENVAAARAFVYFGVSNHYDTQTHSLEEEQLLLDRT